MRWYILNSQINVTQEVFELLRLYYNDSYEVGGIIFGQKSKNSVIIKSISIKKGTSSKINFTIYDNNIFIPPDDMEIIGTWHSHPRDLIPLPSPTDLWQWSNWNKEYIHIIITSHTYSIFNHTGKNQKFNCVEGKM